MKPSYVNPTLGSDDPHLALGPDHYGRSIKLPKGTKLLLVMDPNRADGVVPVHTGRLLVQGGTVKLDLGCECGKRGCTRTIRLQGQWRGLHPSAQDGANEKLAMDMLGVK